METLNFKTLAQVKAANKANGRYFFSRNNMKHDKSIIESGLLNGRYFITSEQPGTDPRKYAIREVRDNQGSIIVNPFPHFRKFESKESAKEFLKKYNQGNK